MDKLPGAIDGHLLAEAAVGNRAALREWANITAKTVSDLSAEQDGALLLLAQALTKMAAGATPNEAFGWPRGGRQPENHVYRDWTIAKYVLDLISRDYLRKDALKAIGKAANMDGSKGGAVERAFDHYRDIDIPEDIFPIPPEDRVLILKVDARVAALQRQK